VPSETSQVLAADIDRVCRLAGSFVVRSGQTVTEYFDKYLFESDPLLLRRVAEAMQPLVPKHTQLLGGLELGGIPIVTMLSSVMGLPALFVRKQAKEYGTRRLAEGAEVAGRRITLVEDVITTGGAVRQAVTALRDAGAAVHTVMCAIDRSPTPGRALDDVRLETRYLFTRADLDLARSRHRET
jgi:orotate phosphoribosyltransferase